MATNPRTKNPNDAALSAVEEALRLDFSPGDEAAAGVVHALDEMVVQRAGRRHDLVGRQRVDGDAIFEQLVSQALREALQT